MGYKLFLDTNIIIDFVQERKFELDAIKEILHLGELGKLQLFISETVITTGFYVLQKEKIEALPVFRELCKTINIVPFSKEIIYFPVEKFKDIEDGLLYFLALHGKMNYFITRNVKDFSFQFPSLPVISPTNFMKEIYLNDIS
ncbi:MAG: type II toxin-antitoxin system VapC family toxin [Ginsengibacter sp.]